MLLSKKRKKSNWYEKNQFSVFSYVKTSLGAQRCPCLLKVTSAVYPHFNDFTGNFRYVSRPTQNQAKNIPVGLLSSQIKTWGKLVQGFLSYDRKNNKQTEITT